MIPSPSTTSTALSTSTILTDDSFKEEASTFRLLVSFAEGKLIINLYDLLSWTLYSKQYNEGSTQIPEIHKKVDLEDIYYSLTEANTTAEGRRQDQVYEYKHGQIVRKNGIPFYSVSQNGKIAVYLTITDQTKGKKLEYISNLELGKVRDMTEIEVLNQKANKQKRDLSKEIADLKKEKEALTTKLTAKQAENVQIKTQLQSQKQEHTIIKQQKSKIESMLTNFIFTKIGDGWQHMLFYKIILYNQVFNFKIKILSHPNSIYMIIGVVDAQKCKTNVGNIYGQSHAVCYYSGGVNKGQKYPSGQTEGTGFAQGQTVDVSVNLAARTVTWSVAGAVRATHTNDILADQNRTFVPFVQAYYSGASMQWIS